MSIKTCKVNIFSIGKESEESTFDFRVIVRKIYVIPFF